MDAPYASANSGLSSVAPRRAWATGWNPSTLFKPVRESTVLVMDGGSTSPRPIGGDEVARASPTWLAVHSDRRLFISDRGNYRSLSVRLGYHTKEKASPTDATERGD